MFERDAELQVLMSDFSWTKNVVQFLVSVYNTQLNFSNSISLKKCVLYTENYGTYILEFVEFVRGQLLYYAIGPSYRRAQCYTGIYQYNYSCKQYKGLHKGRDMW